LVTGSASGSGSYDFVNLRIASEQPSLSAASAAGSGFATVHYLDVRLPADAAKQLARSLLEAVERAELTNNTVSLEPVRA
jgi:hypothetical protein